MKLFFTKKVKLPTDEVAAECLITLKHTFSGEPM